MASTLCRRQAVAHEGKGLCVNGRGLPESWHRKCLQRVMKICTEPARRREKRVGGKKERGRGGKKEAEGFGSGCRLRHGHGPLLPP